MRGEGAGEKTREIRDAGCTSGRILDISSWRMGRVACVDERAGCRLRVELYDFRFGGGGGLDCREMTSSSGAGSRRRCFSSSGLTDWTRNSRGKMNGTTAGCGDSWATLRDERGGFGAECGAVGSW